jgi:hypothetical protein
MDLQQDTNNDSIPNIQVLVELLKNDENGSIPLINFLDNTQYFIEKFQTLELKVQELEHKIQQKTEENDDISNMRKINTYFSTKNVEISENIDVLDTCNNKDYDKEENVQEPQINIENIDELLMTNLEHMENLVQIAKNLHGK